MTTRSRSAETIWHDETGSGPPLVFVHGGWMSADAWGSQVDRFADEYRVITLDIRGHGRTGATDRRRYSIDLFVDDLERLLERLKIERPILCGLSLGSMIVQAYLDRHPHRAAGAVLAGPVRSMPPVELPTGTKSVLSPLPALATSLAVTGPKTTFRSLLASIRAVTGGPWLSVDPAVRSRAVDVVGDVSSPEFRKIFDALYGFEPPDLSHVETPTLVVYGEHEAEPVKRQGEQLASTVGCEPTEIENAGHLVNQDRPDAFNDACAAFFERTKG